MTTGRHQRIMRLEARLEKVSRLQCPIVTYVYSLDDIALDDAINAAIAEQGSHAQRCVALPGKMQRADWIARVRMNQIEG